MAVSGVGNYGSPFRYQRTTSAVAKEAAADTQSSYAYCHIAESGSDKNNSGQGVQNAGVSVSDVYERMSSAGKSTSETEPSVQSESESEKVTEISVASLSNGISFYFNDDTGEVSCVDDTDKRPGRQVLWSKTLSKEELAKCDRLFENYKDEAAGHWVFRFEAYLKHEDFWDMYLDGKVDLAALREADSALSGEALYDKFLREMGKTAEFYS